MKSRETTLQTTAQPQEDITLKMNIPIAAAVPAMRAPFIAMNFFALSRLRSQLFVFARSLKWIAVMLLGWKQHWPETHSAVLLACDPLLTLSMLSATSRGLRSVHRESYHLSWCSEAPIFGLSKVGEVCSIGAWSRISVVEGGW